MDNVKRFFAPPVFDDHEKTRSAELVNTVLVSLAGLGIFGLISVLLFGRDIPLPTYIAVSALIVISLGLFFPLHRGYVNIVSIVIVVTLTLMMTVILFSGGTVRVPSISFMILISVIAGLTLGQKAAYWSAAINVLIVAGVVYGEVNGLLREPEFNVSIQQVLIFAISAIMTVILLNQALAKIQTAVDELTKVNIGLEDSIANRTKALETSAEISRRLASILDPRELAGAVVNQVRDAFDYYYAQIYLFDDAGENLVLTAGTGDEGEAMLKRGHSVPKGRGLVGRASETNTSVLVSDTSEDPDWLPNDLLPETKAEAAIPIAVGDQVLGVLDVQDNVTHDITPEDITLLESLAGQVAISLQNARLYSQADAAAQEARSLVEYAAEGIVVLDLTTGLFIEANENAAKIYGLPHDELLKVGPAQMSPPTQPNGGDSGAMAMEQIGIAMQKGSNTFEWVHINGQGESFPCEIRLVRLPGDKPRVRVSVLDITERKRLQDLTAQRARQQEAINTITQKIQAAATIEEAMQVAARELGHALGNKQTMVALETSALGSDAPTSANE